MNSTQFPAGRSAVVRYGVAVASVALALLLRMVLDPYLQDHLPHVTFYVAVAATAWFGGLWPSMLSAALSSLAADWFFVPPRHSLAIVNTAGVIVGAISYFLVALAFAILSGRMHKARERALARLIELEREVGARRRVEQALRDGEERLSLAFRAAQEGVWDWNTETNAVLYSPRWKQMLGYAEEEIEPEAGVWERLLHPDDQARFHEHVEAFLRGEREYEMEFRLRHKNGHYVPMLSRGIAVRDEKTGRITRIVGTQQDLTAQKQAEQALTKAQGELEVRVQERTAELETTMQALEAERRRFRDVLDVLPVYVVLLAPDYHVPFANRFFRERFGESNGRRCFEYLFGLNEPCENCETYRALKELRPHNWEWNGPDGHLYDIYDFPFIDTDGSTLILETGIDITERKRAQEAYAYLASIVDSSEDAIVGESLDGMIVSWNAGAERLYGYSAQEVIGRPIRILVPPDRPDEIPDILEEIKLGSRIEHYETVRMRKDGRRLHVAMTVSPIKDRTGQVTGASAIARDISQRKLTERALQRANAYNRGLIEANLDALVTIAVDGKITDVNSATEKLTGFSRNELIGTDFCDYFTEAEKARSGYQQVFREGSVRDFELEIRHPDGHVTPVVYNASLYRSEDGAVAGVLAAARDITERRRAAEELRKAALYTRSLIEASLDPLLTINSAGKITDANRAAEQATGVMRDRLIDSEFSECFTEPEKARAGYELVFAQGAVQDYPLTLRHTSGRVTEVLYNATVFRNEAGEVEGVFAAARDISRIKEAEQQIRQLNEELEQRVRWRTAQLEASNKELEAFSYTVSHDLRAPLRAIHGFSGILMENFAPKLEPALRHYLEVISRNSIQMGELIDDLLAFSRLGRQTLKVRLVDATALAREAMERLDGEREGRQVEARIADLPECQADPNLLRQVFVNLLSNALKFTRRREVARIEVGVLPETDPPVFYVRDNGVGFDMRHADKLFGVFQRLHRAEEYGGTGVGLATVQRIIARHGGRIRAEAEPDVGATFYFTIGEPEPAEERAGHGAIG